MIVELVKNESGYWQLELTNGTHWYVGNPPDGSDFVPYTEQLVGIECAKVVEVPRPTSLKSEEVIALSKSGVKSDDIIRLRQAGVL